MEKLIELLEDNDVEVTDDLKSEIESIWPEENDTDDLFTQEEVNEIVKNRLSREQNVHEQEINELKEEMENLVDPEKIEEYEERIDELENSAEQRTASLKKEYELQLAAANAGVKDREYFEFLAEKRNFKDRLMEDEETGDIIVTNEEGEPITTEEGEKAGPELLVNQLKEDKPSLVEDESGEEGSNNTDIGSGGNPNTETTEEVDKNTKQFASELGYKAGESEA